MRKTRPPRQGLPRFIGFDSHAVHWYRASIMPCTLLLAASAAREVTVPSPVDIAGIVAVALAAITTGLTVVAIRYARNSALAARDTVQPMQEMSRELQASTQQLRELLNESKDATQQLRGVLDESKAAVGATRAGRIEDRLTHRLGQYERVMLAVQRMKEGQRRQSSGRNAEYFEEARADLHSALAVTPETEFSRCRQLADTDPGMAQWSLANTEIETALIHLRKELAAQAKRESDSAAS
jgi:hypothetical protein